MNASTITLPALHPSSPIDLSARVEVVSERRVIPVDGKLTWTRVEVGMLVFEGAPTGSARVELYVRKTDGELISSSEKRARAHWAGYVEAAGCRLYQAGDALTAPTRWRQTFLVIKMVRDGMSALGQVIYDGYRGTPRYIAAPTIDARS